MPLFDEKVFFANPVAQFQTYKNEIMQAIEDVCSKGPHVLGEPVEKFEKEFAQWNGVDHCIGVASGTDALALTLKAFGIGAGDEVITVSHTALATVAAIVLAGATPVLIDVDKDTFTLDTKLLDKALSAKTKAIIPVHLYGYACDMDAIMVVAKQKGLIVIEDCAQAHGAIYKGQKVGSIGHAGCFSFYPTKNLGAIGDGGAIITSNNEISQKLKQIRQYGWDKDRIAQTTGTVSRLDTLQAAILSVKLKYLDRDLDKRRSIAAIYDESINWNKYGRAKPLENTSSSYHLYVITSDKRKDIMAKLQSENIIAGIHYEHPAHQMPGYKKFIRIPSPLSVTEKLSNRVISLPMYPEFDPQNAEKIGKFLNDI